MPFGGGGGAVLAGAGLGGAFPAAGGAVLPAGGGAVFPGAFAGEAAVFLGSVDLAAGAFFASYALGASVAGVSCLGGSSFFLGILPKLSSVSGGRISVTIPAAIVLPPSLKANLLPFSIVMGK